MKRETLAELVARTVIEFEKREAELQKASQIQEQNQEQKEDKPKCRPKSCKSKAA